MMLAAMAALGAFAIYWGWQSHDPALSLIGLVIAAAVAAPLALGGILLWSSRSGRREPEQ